VQHESPIPRHIPSALIVDFDAFDSAQFGDDPHSRLAWLHDKPDVFYTPRNGGHWVVTGEQVAREIVSLPEIFSANLPRFDRTVQAAMPYVVPLHADPPDHTTYRKALAPLFTAAAVRQHEARVRAVAQGLVAGVAAAGQCDFPVDIAQRFHVAVFLHMVAVPEDRANELLAWVGAITRMVSPESFAEASAALTGFLKETIAARRRRAGSDMVSDLLRADYAGRAADDETVLSLCGNLFVGGLDTVVATSSLIMLLLGRRAELLADLRRQPRPLPEVVIDELMRRCGTVTNARALTRDYELSGVPFRAGDRVDLMYQLMATDPASRPRPLDISYDRGNQFNIIFGLGAHRCVGTHLARLELRLLLEEWLGRIPEFQLRPGAEVAVRGGSVWAPQHVPLRWTA
jgi:cytochrome P450